MEKENNKIEIKVSRHGVCMGDDISHHYMDITVPLVDCFTIEELLKIIDIWLIKYGDIIWKVSIKDSEVLGLIKIEKNNHIYEVLSNKKLTDFEQPICLKCKIIKNK